MQIKCPIALELTLFFAIMPISLLAAETSQEGYQITEALKNRVRDYNYYWIYAKPTAFEKEIGNILNDLEGKKALILQKIKKEEGFDPAKLITHEMIDKSVSKYLQEEAHFKAITTDIVYNLYSNPLLFEWCPCPEATREKRIMLAIEVCSYIQQNFAQQDDLTYTTLGSGKLLQDYLILKWMRDNSYSKLTINLIDHKYANYVAPNNDISSVINNLRELLFPHYACNYYPGTNKIYSDAINIFVNADQLLSFCARQECSCSTIVVMVDPGQAPSDPTEASEINSYFMVANNLLIGARFVPSKGIARTYMSYDPIPEASLVAIPTADAYLIFYKFIGDLMCPKGHAWLLGHNILKSFSKQDIIHTLPKSLYEIKPWISQYLSPFIQWPFGGNFSIYRQSTQELLLKAIPEGTIKTINALNKSRLGVVSDRLNQQNITGAERIFTVMIENSSQDDIEYLLTDYLFNNQDQEKLIAWCFEFLINRNISQLSTINDRATIKEIIGRLLDNIISLQLFTHNDRLFNKQLEVITQIIRERTLQPQDCLEEYYKQQRKIKFRS